MAGRVAGVGRNVTQFRPGDDVFGEVHSAYAEFVCVAENRIGTKPTNLTFEQAAAVPLAGITALQGLRAWAGNDRFADRPPDAAGPRRSEGDAGVRQGQASHRQAVHAGGGA